MISNVTAVTVTYGRRWHLLSRLLETLESCDCIADIVVVDNGSHEPIEGMVRKAGFLKVGVIKQGRNTGSALGFRVGLEAAATRGAEYIWLLDDDNLPQREALEALISAHVKLSATQSEEEFALLSFRPDHQADIAAGVPLARCYPRPGSFFGFHLADVPYKIWRRMPSGRPRRTAALPETVSVPHAPYSGFFFHRRVMERIGLPNADFVLYADDTEFTARLTRSGGTIYLVPASRLDDLEQSWNIKARFGSSFEGWLKGDSDLRAFYGSRNQAYLQTHQSQQSGLYLVNRLVYVSLLALNAVRWRRLKRFRLLVTAIRRGEAGQLGVHSEHPLV